MSTLVISAAVLLFQWNLAFTIASLLALAYAAARSRGWLSATASSDRGFHHSLLAVAAVAPLLALALGPPNIFRAPVQIFAEPTSFLASDLANRGVPALSFAPTSEAPAVTSGSAPLYALACFLVALSALVLAFRVARLGKDASRLKSIVKSALPFKSLGRVRVSFTDRCAIPFSARLGGRAHVILPLDMIENWTSMRLALLHELQHHRQNDFLWLALIEPVRALFGWNPLVRGWIERIEEAHELACDEALLGRRAVDNHAYATCLFEAAQRAAGGFRLPAGTAGMSASPSFLKRRIEMAFEKKDTRASWVARAAAMMAVAGVAVSSWAGQGLVVDRRVSHKEAVALASKVSASSGIPIVVNARVVKWLNAVVGNPRMRFYMRNNLRRMPQYEPMIRAKLKAANLPMELLAVPLLESGYQNTEARVAAGIWQFIPQTARNYGLRVDDTADERLNPEKLTDAAVAYFTHMQGMFSDWHASLLGYNAGERKVKDEMAAAGHRDVLRLVEEGSFDEESRNYVAKIIVGILILKNPDLVKD